MCVHMCVCMCVVGVGDPIGLIPGPSLVRVVEGPVKLIM